MKLVNEMVEIATEYAEQNEEILYLRDKRVRTYDKEDIMADIIELAISVFGCERDEEEDFNKMIRNIGRLSKKKMVNVEIMLRKMYLDGVRA